MHAYMYKTVQIYTSTRTKSVQYIKYILYFQANSHITTLCYTDLINCPLFYTVIHWDLYIETSNRLPMHIVYHDNRVCSSYELV